MRFILFFILIFALQAQDPIQECILEECNECDFQTDPVTCLTCRGWYQTSWDTGFCVVSARLIIATVVGAFLFVALVFCAIMKLKEHEEKKTSRPENIEAFASLVEVSDAELNNLQWKHSEHRANDISSCQICKRNGGTVELSCNHLFHGDCICWHLRNKNSCPACQHPSSGRCRVYCLKCLQNYLECEVEWYVQIKKRKSRICNMCFQKKE